MSSASLRPCWGPVLKFFPMSLGSLASAQCFSEELELVLHLPAKSTSPPLYVCIVFLISGDRILVCNGAWLDTCYTAEFGSHDSTSSSVSHVLGLHTFAMTLG